jgi:hypothetical protein
MKIKLGMIITDASGKIGGAVVSKGRNGHTVRSQPALIKNRSAAITTQKIINTEITQLWRQLSPEQRDEWNMYALTNPPINIGHSQNSPSGFNVFYQSNYNRRITTLLPLFTSPVYGGYVEPPVNMAFAVTTNTFIVTFDNQDGPNNRLLRGQMFATGSLSPGITNVNSKLKMLPNSGFVMPSGTDYFGAYSSVFGAPQIGSQITMKLRQIDRPSNHGSSYVQLSQIVTS